MKIEIILKEINKNKRSKALASAIFLALLDFQLDDFLNELAKTLENDLNFDEDFFKNSFFTKKSARKLIENKKFKSSITFSVPNDIEKFNKVLNGTRRLLEEIRINEGITERINFSFNLFKWLEKFYYIGEKKSRTDIQMLFFDKQLHNENERTLRESFITFSSVVHKFGPGGFEVPLEELFVDEYNQDDKIDNLTEKELYRPHIFCKLNTLETDKKEKYISSLGKEFANFSLQYAKNKYGNDNEAIYSALTEFLERAILRYIPSKSSLFSLKSIKRFSQEKSKENLKPIYDLEASSLDIIFHAFLISASVPDKLPKEDDQANKLACSAILALANIVDQRSSFDKIIKTLAPIDGQKTFREIGLVIGSNRIAEVLNNPDYDIWKILVTQPLEKSIESFSDLILSRITINDPINQIKQFLYEEKFGFYQCPDKECNLYKKIDSLFRQTNDLEDHEDLYKIDGTTGPQQTLRVISASLQSICFDLATHITLSILFNILNRYTNQIKGSVDLFSADASNFNSKFKELSSRSETFKNLWEGNRYRDTYEYAALNFQIKDKEKLEQELKERNNLLEGKVSSLENQSASQKDRLNKAIKTIDALKNDFASQAKYTNAFNETKELLEYALNDNEKLKEESRSLSQLYSDISVELDKVKRENYILKTKTTPVLRNDLGYINKLAENWNFSPEIALQTIQAIAPDRIYIHEKAFKSAKDIPPSCKNNKKLFGYLVKLVFDYLDDFLEFGDQHARNIFHGNLAANESEGTQKSQDPQIRIPRKIEYDGAPIDLKAHLKIGVTPADALRIYFHVDKKKRKIVIGYCGKHPKNLSTS